MEASPFLTDDPEAGQAADQLRSSLVANLAAPDHYNLQRKNTEP